MKIFATVTVLTLGAVDAFQLMNSVSRVLAMRKQKTRDTSTETSYDVDSWRAGFSTCEEEICTVLDGSVPLDIEGTYFRNGYGVFEIGSSKQPVLHPFDSDGMLCAAQFDKGKIFFRNRMIQTSGFQKEKGAEGALFRNAFGTQPKGFFKNLFKTEIKNVANTNVIWFGNRLLALWEGGLPHLIEPDSLDTVGTYTIDGLIPEPLGQFSAHPRVDATTGRMVNFATTRTNTEAVLTVYEFGKDTMAVENRRTFTVPGFPFFHDFIVTENYYIFNQAPTGLLFVSTKLFLYLFLWFYLLCVICYV